MFEVVNYRIDEMLNIDLNLDKYIKYLFSCLSNWNEARMAIVD